jgi:hypothetical protein
MSYKMMDHAEDQHVGMDLLKKVKENNVMMEMI